MTQTATATGPYPPLIAWLESHHIPHEVHEHRTTYTAVETAHAEGTDPTSFAKVVGVRTSEGSNALVVVDASDQVDLALLRDAMDVAWVALLGEEDLRALLPDCDVGTAPPIPDLVKVPVYVDEAVRRDEKISFHAGSHRFTVRVDRAAWEREAGVRTGTFGVLRRSLGDLADRGWT
jgi:Ala-tRNA(Pro) deacylase